MTAYLHHLIRRAATGTIIGALGLSACAVGPAAGPTADDTKEEPGLYSDGKDDAWDYRNDPERFDGDLNYHLEDLPTEGRADRVAWPSTYWPTYDDSVNHRWQRGELSPAEKYDRAFNGWVPEEGFMELRPFDRYSPEPTESWDPEYYEELGPLASRISRTMGNKRDRDLALRNEGGPGTDEEWPVETWWGLCHAWVPASMLEYRPERAVTHNGVTFEVGDMEALLIAAYNRSPAEMIGGRCNLGNDEDNEVERDEQGRAIASECRDTNPGSFHVIMTNYLGMMNRPFAEDRTYDYEVWNQPVVAFDVTKLQEIDVARANDLLRVDGAEYIYNADAATLWEVHATTTYITESHASTVPSDASRYERHDRYTYILEVDADGKIIGGEWYGRSHERLPDFLWSPRQISRSSVSNLNINHVRMLVQMSREPDVPVVPGDVIEVLGQADVAIPDNDAAGAESTAVVRESAVVGSVQVELAIGHSYISDLTITLRHGDQERVIHNREGGSQDDVRKSFNVPGFSGADAAGDWTLEVVDAARLDVGTIEGWTLRITPESDGDTGGTTGGSFPGRGGMAIPDNDDGGIISVADVPPGTAGTTAQAALNITHPYIHDLVIALTSPSGQRWMLQERSGGNADDIIRTIALDPAPTGALGGEWELNVSDRAGRDIGTLNSWSLTIR